MQALLIAGSLQELGLQNRSKTNKIGKVVVIFNGENHSENRNFMNDLIKI